MSEDELGVPSVNIMSQNTVFSNPLTQVKKTCDSEVTEILLKVEKSRDLFGSVGILSTGTLSRSLG